MGKGNSRARGKLAVSAMSREFSLGDKGPEREMGESIYGWYWTNYINRLVKY